MKARIEKKLSKRLVEIAPTIFEHAWIDKEEPSALAWEQGSRVSHIWSVGGEVDYWGEGSEWNTLWSAFAIGDWWCWAGDFPVFPHGHELAGYPDTTGFKPTTQNLLKLAAQCEARNQGAQP
ncbi:hypothetical protein QAO71_10690 [Halopseudomonas sp. SMJS2]|uniref:hypothetical protein n=1 Tax=Halopseudomonas sp. SMJS2 TaxID=3041098 RepID=UPI0024534780|nr:hypothetical protein [Halopseudomonas sp. SMJS2]WGK60560.1 hypothetical protein QAO71_10690 [Halopseudomonas sp. SMJS2]